MPSPDADHELRLDALVLEAAALEPGEREKFLDQAGLEDPDLVAEARRRLARAETMPSVFLATASGGSGTPDGTAADAEPPPESLGPYRVLGRLGEGGMGEVYEGYDDRLDRPVALKRIRPEAGEQDQAHVRFRREARAVAQLSHSAIVQIHDWVEDDHGDWIVMELVDGRSLRDLLASGPLAVEHAVRIARDVAEGLAAAHDAGIVHRDLKPSNVMLAEPRDRATPGRAAPGRAAPGRAAPGRAKILDFGVAKRLPAGAEAPLTAVTTEGRILGTVTAMSPEQAMGHAVDQRSDLFSLGTLLYEMTTGEPPFRGDNLVEVLTRVCTYQQKPACVMSPEVPEALSELIDRLLEKAPEHRPQSAAEVAVALEALLAERPAGTRSVARPRRQLRLTPGIRRWLVAALAVAVVLGWFWSLDRTTESPQPDLLVDRPLDSLTDPQLYTHGMNLLKLYYRKGHIDRAIEAFQTLLTHDGESAAGHAGLARAYCRKYQEEGKDRSWLGKALTVSQRAVALDGHLTAARISLGLASLEMGQLDEAATEFEEVLRIQPGNAEAIRALGTVHEYRSDLERAEALYLEAAEARPEDWQVQLYLGSLQSRTGRYARAEKAFQRATELAPDNVIGYRNLAALYYLDGRYNEAADMFQKALEIRPSAALYSNLGTLLFSQGLYPQAVSAFEKAVGLHGGANDDRIWANLGDAYRWVPNGEEKARAAYRQAILLLKDALAVNPADLNLQSRLAIYRAKGDECEIARRIIEEDIEVAILDANAHFRVALALEICGQREQALAALARAFEAGYSVQAAKADPELTKLREDPEFHRLLISHADPTPDP